jgi:hypothetical protein
VLRFSYDQFYDHCLEVHGCCYQGEWLNKDGKQKRRGERNHSWVCLHCKCSFDAEVQKGFPTMATVLEHVQTVHKELAGNLSKRQLRRERFFVCTETPHPIHRKKTKRTNLSLENAQAIRDRLDDEMAASFRRIELLYTPTLAVNVNYQ